MKRKIPLKLNPLSKTIVLSSAFLFFTHCNNLEHNKKHYYNNQDVTIEAPEISFNKIGSKEFFRGSLSKIFKKKTIS